MINAFKHIFLFHTLDGLTNHVLVAAVDQAHELLRPQLLELRFDDREDHFDRVVAIGKRSRHGRNVYLLWLVWDIVDVSEAQPPHLLLRPLGCVCRQIIHKEANP